MVDLSGVRLGKHERAILLGAGSKEFQRIACVEEIEERMMSVISRARRKLEDAGLIDLGWTHPMASPRIPVQRRNRHGYVEEYTMYKQHCLYRLTDLGERVVTAFRNDLESGQPIRWAKLPGPEQP